MKEMVMKAIFGLFALACASVIPAGATAQETLKLGHVLAAGSQFSEAVRVMNEELKARTGGRYAVEEFAASTLGTGPAMLEALKVGTLDMVISSSGGALAQFNPAVGVLDLMLLFRDAAHADRVLDGPIGDGLLASFKERGVVGLAWAENGFRQLTSSLRPIRTPEDMAGLKIRIAESDIYRKAYESLGAKPFALAFAHLYPALKSGQAEAQENPITTIVGAKLQEVQRYITLSNHTYAPAVILINADRFSDLSAADREALRAAAQAGGNASRAFVRSRDAAGLEVLKASGIAITTAAEFDRAGFEKALEPFYQEMARSFPKETIDAIRNTR